MADSFVPGTRDHEAFVSYARDDKALITTLVHALEGEGFNVFWDPNIRVGEDWELVIEDQLNAAKAVIVAWTSKSRRSQWVRAEAHAAYKQRKLIPLQLDASGPPLFFNTVQTADFIGWDGDKSAECWQRLTIMLKGILEAAKRQEVEEGQRAPSVPQEDAAPETGVVTREASQPTSPTVLPTSRTPKPKPKPLHATPRSGLPWLTILAAAASVVGLIIASALGSWILGSAILIAAVIFVLFRTADNQMPPAFHALAKRWLMPVKDGLRINVAEAFHDMFKAVFWHRHVSWQCFVRSAFASTIAFGVVFGFAWLFIDPFQAAFRAEWGSFLRNLIITFLIANILADYLSLFQTRLFIRFLERRPWTAPLVVVVDFLATMAILLVVLYAVNAGSQWLGHVFGGGAEERLAEQGAATGRELAVATSGFTWPSFMGFYEGLIPQLTNPDAGFNDLWARTWLLIVASITTYITSVWLVFIMAFGGVLRAVVGRDGEPTPFGRLLEARDRPFTAFGAASAAWVLMVAAPVYAVAATMPRPPVTDETPDSQPQELDPALVEQSAWATAQTTDTLAAYRAYIDAHPLGANAMQARTRIDALRDAQAWAQAQTADTISAYEQYLALHANGANVAAARSRIDAINAEALLSSEQTAWARAQADDTVGAYERYLDAYPEGANAAAAQVRMAELQDDAFWQTVQDDGTLLGYETYVQRAERTTAPDPYEEEARAAIAAHYAAVERLQRALQDKGFDPGGVDGVAGAGTQAAVNAFLLASGGSIDGEPIAIPDLEAINDGPILTLAATVEEWTPSAQDVLDARRTRSSTRAPLAENPERLLDFALFRDCAACPEMVVLPSGSFRMGSPANEVGRQEDEDTRAGEGGSQRTVNIGYRLAVGRFEVTFNEWDACVADGYCSAVTNDSGWGRGRRPVISVSWNDITGTGVSERGFLAWMNSKVEGSPYRLLSETEWEYAARGGTTSTYSTGDTITTAQANFNGDNFLRQTVPVGGYEANPFGLFDVHGNVWEWLQDCYRGSYASAPSDARAVDSRNCPNRVDRGGSWVNSPQNLRSADRNGRWPDDRFSSLGFRLARTL